MPEDIDHKTAEVITYEGEKYVRINAADIDVTVMTQVVPATDIVAAQVTKGVVKVITKHGKLVETINHAQAGDWVAYSIGSSDFRRMFDKMMNSPRKVISKENFNYLYQHVPAELGLTSENILELTGDVIMDNDDNKEFTDSSFLHNLRLYKYIGKAVMVASVPFNFVIRAPWGKDQFVRRGGMVIYDTNSSHKSGEREIYGMEGAENRVPGEFEKTFSMAGGEKRIIADTFKLVMRADRSPIAGIQFNNRDLAKALERAGKHIPKFLQKFTDHH